MKFSVPYGKGKATFNTEAPCLVADAVCQSCPEPDDVMRKAVNHPVGGAAGFGAFAKASKKHLFILCDGTRPTPTALVLEHLYPHIKSHPDVSFIIATGSHRAPTDAEFHTFLQICPIFCLV